MRQMNPKLFFLDLIPVLNTIIDIWLFYHYKPFSICRRSSHGLSHQNRPGGSPQVRSVLLGVKQPSNLIHRAKIGIES